MPNPCQTRDLPMPTCDFSRKTPGFKKKPGFSEPVLNPCQTRDLPVPTREKNMGLGAVRMTKTIVRITGFLSTLGRQNSTADALRYVRIQRSTHWISNLMAYNAKKLGYCNRETFNMKPVPCWLIFSSFWFWTCALHRYLDIAMLLMP